MAAGPSSVERLESGDTTCWVLPPRRLGWLRWLGLPFMLIGAVFALHPLWALWHSWQRSSGLAPLIGVPFAIFGLAPVGIGLFVIAGRTEIRLTPAHLLAIERAGPLHWTHGRYAPGSIRRLDVRSVTQDGSQAPTPLRDLTVLWVEYEGGNSPLAVGYPRALLRPLANDIASKCAELAGGEGGGVAPTRVEVVEHDPTGAVFETTDEIPPQPKDSLVTLERTADGLTLRVPPLGFFRGSGGIGVFAVMWTASLVVIACVFGGITLSGGSGNLWSGVPIFGVVMGVFCAVGVFLLVQARRLGSTGVIFDVTADALLVSRASTAGVEQRQWGREEVSGVAVAPTGTRVNNRPVLQIKVTPRTGRPYGVLAGRQEDELRWIAAELRAALGPPAKPFEDGPAETYV
jgi:hypothetical protein